MMKNMMKNTYVSPEMLMISVFCEDILTVSPTSTANFGIELDWETDGI
ncbi:MAG: hypothetical protein IJW55_00445 [Clostridia bacterium]|nr:hypothetical protein [Clostridia bacterium]